MEPHTVVRAPRYSRSPYVTPLQTRRAVVFCPDEYSISQLCALSADALRLLMVIGAKIDPSTGTSHCPKVYLRQFMARHSSNLQRVTTELLRGEFIARANQKETYFVNPKAFKPVSITI